MKTISQRELRNDNARVVREVEDGETFTVTRRGVPVARLVPPDPESDLPVAKPARPDVDITRLSRVPSPAGAAELLDDLRSDR